MTINLNVTRYALSLGSRDSQSGWRTPTWTTSTITPFYTESKGVNSAALQRAGVYATQDMAGLSYDQCNLLDRIGTYDNRLFQIVTADKKTMGDSLLFYAYQMTELPMWQTQPATGIFTYKVAPSDPRYRTKVFLDTYLNTSAFIDNNGVAASVPVIFSDPPYPVASEFRNATTPVAGLILIAEPSNAEARMDYVDNKPFGYKETIPIITCTMNSSNIIGVHFKWRIEAELRKVFEEHPSGSFRHLVKRTEPNAYLGKEPIFMTEWQCDYYRDLTA